ncbi:MAG: hypothetical protein ACYDA9_15525 [Terriglobia bacterium]
MRNLSLVLFATVICCGCHKQQQPAAKEISWLNPGDQALLNAASLGYQGSESDPIVIYDAGKGDESDPGFARSLRMCRGEVATVEIDTPLLLAQGYGYSARQKFNPTPSLTELQTLRNKALIIMNYGSKSLTEEAMVAVSMDNVFYKPKSTEDIDPKTFNCEDVTSDRVLSHTVTAIFEGDNALPKTGKGTVIVRRNSIEDSKFDIDFDMLR